MLIQKSSSLLARRFISSHSPTFFVTTPIFYVNDKPHIGHLYSACIADAFHRWNRMKARNTTLFSTGTDEHGFKIQQTAKAKKMKEIQLCDETSSRFRSLFDSCAISYNQYIRTTEERHIRAVNQFWSTLTTKGLIKKHIYEGWYSVNDESFIAENEVLRIKDKDGTEKCVSAESGHLLEWLEEENYMFRLSAFQSDLRTLLKRDFVQPSTFVKQVENWIENDLKDLSISRDRGRVHWGIQVPGDPSQTIYVWMDALINYLTVAGYPDQLRMWPPDVQVIGKDILRFHAVFWPAFLIGAGLEPPAKIHVHSHWMVDGRKMSKSLGNVVDPAELIGRCTVDGLRYFLLREGTPHADNNFVISKVIECINAELCNTMGNLLQRSTSQRLNPKGIFPSFDEAVAKKRFSKNEFKLMDNIVQLKSKVVPHFDEGSFYRGVKEIMDTLRDANAFFHLHQPWTLVDKDPRYCETIIHVCLRSLHVAGILLNPIIPSLSSSLLDRLNLDPSERRLEFLDSIKFADNESRPLPLNKSVLFERIKP